MNRISMEQSLRISKLYINIPIFAHIYHYFIKISGQTQPYDLTHHVWGVLNTTKGVCQYIYIKHILIPLPYVADAKLKLPCGRLSLSTDDGKGFYIDILHTPFLTFSHNTWWIEIWWSEEGGEAAHWQLHFNLQCKDLQKVRTREYLYMWLKPFAVVST